MESSDQLRAMAALTTGERNPMLTEQEAGLTPEPAYEFLERISATPAGN